MEHANPLQRLLARQRRGPLPRLSGEEELEVLNHDIELQFRGKHVVSARALFDFAERAQHIPGLMESAERVCDFFEDGDSGNWVDGSALFRVSRADQSNRLKRFWRDFEHRRITLRQYLGTELSGERGVEYIRFKLPEARFVTPRAFVHAFRHLVGGLDRLCRLVVDDGFGIAGFREHAGWVLLRPESPEAFAVGREILQHFHWFRQQAEDVRRLEERRSISDEYARAAKSLASAQLRHLRVLLEGTVREHLRGHPGERLEKAVEMAAEYIGVLDGFVAEGADVAFPIDTSHNGDRAA